ncbi:DNA polymerase III delta prime subunit [Hoeflea marina]|uniref:DNA polymerase III delta prime subunit n=2 Tax=Hoeflea marina TaxID=274592 RepID=A0A317PQT5_9HYPH|nr:DNA polymerase III delta prime subunit [Hoeflea marina]
MSDSPGLLDGAVAPAENTRLFGHGAAEQFLADAYRSGRMHHALLIEGPEGIGKATLAFRFANHVLSHPDPASAPARMADPDPQSPAFRQIMSGASHNLMHIDRPVDAKTGKAKSVITVDEVRKAARFFGQTSGTGNWRIAIIDPADDLNRNAANAILKILEEPPKRALFFVLSHAPGKLLPTIRSRCLPLRLKPLSEADLGRALGHLGVPGADPAALSRLSEGSVARALMLINYGGADIANAFDAIFDSGRADDRAAVYAIADTLSARDRDVAYQFFTGHVIDRVRGAAGAAASAGDLGAAAHWAELAGEIVAHFDTAEAYNLDRKQTVLSLFTMLFG